MRTMLVVGLGLATISTLPAVGQTDCAFDATRSAILAASASDLLDLTARAGSLTLRGVDDAAGVRVVGRACASSEDLLDQLQLVTARAGETIRVEVPEVEDDSRALDRYYRMDLEIEVPKGMLARVSDGSGDLTIEGVGNLELDDGSGDVRVQDIAGDVTVDDGSGEILIDGVQGSVRIDDGSGEIRVRNIEGTVEVVDDGSGSIDVRNVAGDFIVRDDGSGDISYANVSGRVRIPRR